MEHISKVSISYGIAIISLLVGTIETVLPLFVIASSF